MLTGEKQGKDLVVAYVRPRFCTLHDISKENQAMKLRRLSLFKAKVKKKVSNEVKRAREQRDTMEVLAANAIKMQSSGGQDQEFSIVGSQIARLPLLFCNTDGQPYKSNTKTRKFIEGRYPNSIKQVVSIPKKTSIYVRDGMQDIFMRPKSHFETFDDYYKMFAEIKVANSFYSSNTVLIAFDTQNRSASAKDQTRKRRDAKCKECPDVPVSSTSPLPHSYDWLAEFLGNRVNKKSLVHFLSSRLLEFDGLKSEQTLYISFENQVWKLQHDSEPMMLTNLTNNHEESDTRVFFIVNALAPLYDTVLIRSTDSDLLFVYLANADKIVQKVYIHFSSDGEFRNKYADCTQLLKDISEDPDPTVQQLNTRYGFGKILAWLHIVTGGDDLCFLRGFTKEFCCKAVLKYGTFIFDDDVEFNEIVENNQLQENALLDC